MRIAIVGAGGVGGWFAAKLLQHGADDTIVVLRESFRPCRPRCWVGWWRPRRQDLAAGVRA